MESMRQAAVVQLARDFFAVRGVDVIVVALAASAARPGVLRALGSDGRFQVASPPEGAAVESVLDSRTRVAVGILMRWADHTPPWLQPRHRDWFNGSYHWLVLDDDEGGGMEPGDDLGLAVGLESEVFRVRRGAGDTWLLEEVYRVNNREPYEEAVRRPFAEWSPARGLAEHRLLGLGRLAERRTQTRRALAGPRPVHPHAAVFCEHRMDPALLDRVTELPAEVVLRSMSYLNAASLEVVLNIFERYNMTPRLHEYTTAGELELPPSGHFTGAVGAVQRGAGDIFTSGALVSDSRIRTCKFASTTFKLRATCLFLSGGSLGTVGALLAPLEPTAWLGTAALVLATVILGKWLAGVEGRQAGWGDALFSCFGTFTGQGFGESGAWASGRLLLLTCELLFLLVQGYYSSAIVQSLLSPPPAAVRSDADLLHSDLVVALHNWWLIVREFERAPPGSVFRRLWEGKMAPPAGPGVFPADQLAALLTRPQHAIVSTQEILYKTTAVLDEGQACRLNEFGMGSLIHVGPMLNRHVDYKEAAYVGVLVQRERGVLARVNSKWRTARTMCNGDRAQGDPIGLAPVLPALGGLLAGLAAAWAVVLVELKTTNNWSREVKSGYPSASRQRVEILASFVDWHL